MQIPSSQIPAFHFFFFISFPAGIQVCALIFLILSHRFPFYFYSVTKKLVICFHPSSFCIQDTLRDVLWSYHVVCRVDQLSPILFSNTSTLKGSSRMMTSSRRWIFLSCRSYFDWLKSEWWQPGKIPSVHSVDQTLFWWILWSTELHIFDMLFITCSERGSLQGSVLTMVSHNIPIVLFSFINWN